MYFLVHDGRAGAAVLMLKRLLCIAKQAGCEGKQVGSVSIVTWIAS